MRLAETKEAYSPVLSEKTFAFAEEQGKDVPRKGGIVEHLVVLNMSAHYRSEPPATHLYVGKQLGGLQATAKKLPDLDGRLYSNQVCANAVAFALA